MQQEQHTLIPPREALKIITWVNYFGLYRGARGTDVLTRFPHGCFSKEECEKLRDSMIDRGIASRDKRPTDPRPREVATELI